MEVSTWSNGGEGRGLRIGKRNRDAYFNEAWSEIIVEIEGNACKFKLTPSFWKNCPEIRGKELKPWLETNGMSNWPKGHPHKVKLIPLRGNCFRLEK